MKITFLNPPELGVLSKGHYIFTNDGRRFGPMTAAQAAAYSKEPIDVMSSARTEHEAHATDELDDAQVSLPCPRR
jgi:hypothetical protein